LSAKVPKASRYLGKTAHDSSRYLRTAETYVSQLLDTEAVGLYQKPLDWNLGNPNFFQNMYQVLNILQAMALPQGARIAEVGSGSGWLTELLVGLGYEVWAVEPAPDMVAAARIRVESYMRHHHFEPPYKVRFFCETMETCSLPDESVDAILFHESLHHVIDEDKALSACIRILRPGGVLATSGESNWVPGNSGQESSWNAEMARFGTLESPFTYEYLHQKLEEHGFAEIVRYHGINRNVPVTQENATVKELANYSAVHLNNITARKPFRIPTTTTKGAVARAAIHVSKATLSADGREASLTVRLHNNGSVLWSHQAFPDGYVSIAFCGHAKDVPMVEAGPRGRLPQLVWPGEEIELNLTYYMPAGDAKREWVVDMVCEGRYWFGSQGTEPAKVRFA